MKQTAPQFLLVVRRPLIAVLHALLITAAWVGSFALRLDFTLVEPYRNAMLATLPVVVIIKLAVFYAFRLFQGWWRYVGFRDLMDIAKATTIGSLASIIASLGMYGRSVAEPADFPLSVFLLDLGLTFFLIGGVRFAVRAYTESLTRYRLSGATPKRVLVVGAGGTGRAIVREMRANPATLGFQPAGFVDDDPHMRDVRIDGVPVMGAVDDVPALLASMQIDEVLLAISGAPGHMVRRLMDVCHEHHVIFKTVPSVSDLIDGRISVSRIRDVKIEDLLGREPVQTNLEQVRSNTEGHVILVTGAAGSIGSELSRQLALLGPAHLVLFERSESDLHDLELMLRQVRANVRVTAMVGDVLDVDDLQQAFQVHRPSRVYHAAAYKHVPMMERHVIAAVRNNVIGTYNVATAAERFGSAQMVLISTDKAVRPTSLMGATKRAAERVLLSMGDGRTRFTAVRFGNVLGSRGSVVPIFKRQIDMGGPVTVTHPDVVRFFMTIPEAVQLVLQASAASRGGDIFHLDMGEPVRIADLAANMILLSGLEPGRDIEVQFVGLRPGEKLYEELLLEGEDVEATEHPRVRVVRTLDSGVGAEWMERLQRAAAAREIPALIDLICTAVPEFTPSDLVLPPDRRTTPTAPRVGR